MRHARSTRSNGDKAQTVADSIGPALRSLPGTPSRPTGWRAALGGLLLATPAVVFAGWVGGADAVLIALLMSAVWTTLALASELGGARQPSTVARVRGLGRRATTWGGLLAVVGVSGLVPLDDVRTTFPVLALSAVGSVLAVLQQARAASPQRLVLVGTRSDVEAYAASIATHGSVLLVGACVVAGERSLTVDAPLLVPTVRSLDRVAELASEVGADAVVVVPGQAVDADDVRALTWDFERLPVTLSIAAPIAAVARHRMHLRSLAGESVIDLAVPRAGVATRVGKTALDRVGALVLLVLASPVLLIMWAAVRLDSRGPGLFVQTRVGRDGVPFRMYKMRSMHIDAEARLAEFVAENEMDGTLFKIRRDPRVTRVGDLLRRSSLDELPQLWNVLAGTCR